MSLKQKNKIFEFSAQSSDSGVVYTKVEVAHFMLDLVGYQANNNLSDLRILEPSAGDGAFVKEILSRLILSSKNYRFDLLPALSFLCFTELEVATTVELKKLVQRILEPEIGFASSKIWAEKMVKQADFLDTQPGKFDVIIGNPPYVRHEQIPDARKIQYKRKFSTFRHRSDLYIPFFEHALKLLDSQGKLCFICSNRWLRNQYGGPLRHLISQQYGLQKIIGLEKTQPFQKEVIAYPAITLIHGSPHNGPTEIFQLDNLEQLNSIMEGKRKPARLAELPKTKDWAPLFISIGHHFSRLKLIEAQGFKIGIGVATGADKVFIGPNLKNEIEEELLLPIVTSKCLRNDCFEWKGNFVINPFDEGGNLINLSSYPRANAYFLKHQDLLKRRHIAQKNPAYWFRTIDRIQATLIQEPKILLPDISGNQMLFIDEGKFYPHHNLYYITGPNLSSLQLLAAVLMSDFIRSQLAQLSTRMNGGYPRWQSQNLRKLRLPVLDWLAPEIKDNLISAYQKQDVDAINDALQQAPLSGYHQRSGQLELGW